MRQTIKTKRFARAVGERIRSARKAKGLTQSVAGARLDLDAPAICRMESGSRDLRLSDLYALGRVYGVAPRDFLDVPLDAHTRSL